MGISRSAYYDAPVSAPDDTAIVQAMSAICDEFERYGWRRVQAALRQQGVRVNHKKVKRCKCRFNFPQKRRSKIPQSGGLAISHERDWRLRSWVGVRVA